MKYTERCWKDCVSDADATASREKELAKQKGHRVDALALRADERRDKLR